MASMGPLYTHAMTTTDRPLNEILQPHYSQCVPVSVVPNHASIHSGTITANNPFQSSRPNTHGSTYCEQFGSTSMAPYPPIVYNAPDVRYVRPVMQFHDSSYYEPVIVPPNRTTVVEHQHEPPMTHYYPQRYYGPSQTAAAPQTFTASVSLPRKRQNKQQTLGKYQHRNNRRRFYNTNGPNQSETNAVQRSQHRDNGRNEETDGNSDKVHGKYRNNRRRFSNNNGTNQSQTNAVQRNNGRNEETDATSDEFVTSNRSQHRRFHKANKENGTSDSVANNEHNHNQTQAQHRRRYNPNAEVKRLKNRCKFVLYFLNTLFNVNKFFFSG